ncbi:MAG TPA: serine acetyltransferase [Propionibacterium sp.]|nr:serine acetyltransferase [Propionibacterium sp.]
MRATLLAWIRRTSSKRWWAAKLAKRFPVVDVIREDRHVNGGLTQPGCQTIILHRIATWSDTDEAPRGLRTVLQKTSRLGLRMSKAFYGIELPAAVTVGRRVRIVHQGGIVIHPSVVIEDDVLIRQNVTIGLRGDNDKAEPHAVPIVRRGASFGAGAVAVGPIEIGEDAVVGANAVVTQDVPPYGKAMAPRAEVRASRPELRRVHP